MKTLTTSAPPAVRRLYTAEPKNWVVVIHPGEENEEVWGEYHTYDDGLRAIKDAHKKLSGFDLMKRDADGNLTTEF
ncbi:hypothetical protein [Polaromonas sp.]|uniref:hypothetical protein n=1 Tax=Polaromonas sp. TaxID=1869339 RepID=UPI003C9A5267